MIPNGKGCKAKFKGHKAKSQGQQQWHYLAVKRISTLLRGIISKHHRDFFLSELPSFIFNMKRNFNRMKMYVKIKLFVL